MLCMKGFFSPLYCATTACSTTSVIWKNKDVVSQWNYILSKEESFKSNSTAAGPYPNKRIRSVSIETEIT